MKKIILFLVVVIGLVPMVTEQGLTVSANKIYAQDVDMGLETLVCMANPRTTTDTYGDWIVTTTCTLVLDEIIQDCVDDCYADVIYFPSIDQGTEPDTVDTCFPYPCDGGGTGGAYGGVGNTGGSNTNSDSTATNCQKRTGYLHDANFTNKTPLLGNNTTIAEDNFRNDSWGIISETNCGNGKIPKGSTVNVLSTTAVTRTGTTLKYFKVEYNDCEKGNNPSMPSYDANKPCSDCYKGNPLMNMTKILPTPKGNIGSGLYGYARGRLHDGIDFDKPSGQPIYAMFNGVVGKVVSSQKEGDKWKDRVSWTGDKNAAGNRIYISSTVNGNTVKIGYWHLSTVSVNPSTNLILKTGDYVKQGDLIGYTGTTGSASSSDSSGPHLHLNAQKNGVSIDPNEYLKAEINKTTGVITTPCD